MVRIEYNNGENEIFNSTGHQLHGSKTAGLPGLNPRELLEAALGLCVSMTLTKILERDGITLEEPLHIEVTASKAEDGGNLFAKFDVKYDISALDEEYRAKLRTLVERGCTISNTLKHASEITLSDTVRP